MNTFDVRWGPTAAATLRRAIGGQRVSAWCGIVSMLLLVATQVLSLTTTVGSSSSSSIHLALVWLAVFVLVVAGGVIGLSVWQLLAIRALRRDPPVVALRVDSLGVWQWPMAAGELFLPWDAVGSIALTPLGIQLLPVAIDGAVPGAVGLTNLATRTMLKRQVRRPGIGLAWPYLERFDQAAFDQAVAHLSGGRHRLQRL